MWPFSAWFFFGHRHPSSLPPPRNAGIKEDHWEKYFLWTATEMKRQE